MRKSTILFLFAIIFLVLTACNDDEPTSTDGPPKDAEESKESENEPTEPDPKKLHRIVEKTVNNIHKVMQARADSIDEWNMTQEEIVQALQQEQAKAIRPLSKYVGKESVEEYAAAFLEAMTCNCDANLIFTERDLIAGFTVTNYTVNMFEAESVTVIDPVLYDSGWKSNWTFIKEDNHWKLQDHEFIYPNAGNGLFNITFEDIEHSFFEFDQKHERYTNKVIPIEFVEYIEEEGVRYLVIQMPEKEYKGQFKEPGSYVVYNTELAIEDMQLTEAYNE